MADVAVIRTVPLAKDTRNSWTQAGARVIPRKTVEAFMVKANPEPMADIVLNLGWRTDIFKKAGRKVFNLPSLVRALSYPGDLRRTLGEFLPPLGEPGKPHWHKLPGYGGEGKTLCADSTCSLSADSKEDMQSHVEGDEYRINTVGDTIVQAHKKIGDPVKGFEFFWVGVQGISQNGIIPMLKEAIQSLPESLDWQHSVLGWDIIVGPNGPVILECNTSAGVNYATALRIVQKAVSLCV